MRKNGTCSTFKKEKEKVHQFLLNTFGSATIFLSAAWAMIFVTHLRSIWISIPFSFLYNCELTSVILFRCTRSFSIQDHICFLSSPKRIASKGILFTSSMSLCNIQSLELGGYVDAGDKSIEIWFSSGQRQHKDKSLKASIRKCQLLHAVCLHIECTMS